MKDIDTLVRCNDAYYNGALAQRRELSRDLNPHVEAQALYREAWFNGWDDAKNKSIETQL